MKTTTESCFNLNTALKSILLLGFASFFLYTIFSGSVNMYVHPRNIPIIIFASAVMIIIAFLMLGGLFTISGKKIRSWSLLFYIIPLIMAFALPAKAFSSNDGSLGSVEFSGIDSKADSTPSQKTGQAADSGSSSDPGSSDNVSGGAKDSGLQIQDGVIKVTDSNFYQCVNEIYSNIDKYIGMKIECVGMVFKSDQYTNEEFAAARLMMVCCAADMVPVGFMCSYAQASELKTDSWKKVTGIIDQKQCDGNIVPYVKVLTVEDAEKPDNEYIYPY